MTPPTGNTPEDILASIGEPAAFGGTITDWTEAQTARPDDSLPFLDKSALPSRLSAAGLDPGRAPEFYPLIDRIATDDVLRSLAWYFHWRIFLVPEKGPAWGAPSLEPCLKELSGLFFLLLSLELAPRLLSVHYIYGYPVGTTKETLLQIGVYESNHLKGSGQPGIYGSQFVWFPVYLTQPFVRLGRFEYQMHPYEGGVSVWERESDGILLAMAEDGARFDPDGLLAAENHPTAGTARLTIGPDSVIGHPVSPEGTILNREITLSRKEWRQFLVKGDRVLDLHIPAGGRMDWDAITSSFRLAADFFRKHHASEPCQAVVVSSWFMDPRLADLLPPDSNPLKLQRAVYLYPTGPAPDSLWFVFLRNPSSTPTGELPEDTSLRKSLKAFLSQGKTWKGGGFFLPFRDLTDLAEGRYIDGFKRLDL